MATACKPTGLGKPGWRTTRRSTGLGRPGWQTTCKPTGLGKPEERRAPQFMSSVILPLDGILLAGERLAFRFATCHNESRHIVHWGAMVMAGDEPTGKTKMRDAMSLHISVFIAGFVLVGVYVGLYGAEALFTAPLAFSAGLLTRKLPAILAYVVAFSFVHLGIYSAISIVHLEYVTLNATHVRLLYVGILLISVLLVYLDWYNPNSAKPARPSDRISLGFEMRRRSLDLVTAVVLVSPIVGCSILVVRHSDASFNSIEGVVMGYPLLMVMAVAEAFTVTSGLFAIAVVCLPIARLAVLRVTAVPNESMRPKRGRPNFFGDK